MPGLDPKNYFWNGKTAFLRYYIEKWRRLLYPNQWYQSQHTLEIQMVEMTILAMMIVTMMMMTVETETDAEEIMMMDLGEALRGKEGTIHPGGQDRY